MANNSTIQRYRNWYAKLLRFYPKSFHQRFGEGMAQTFSDLLRECAEQERGFSRLALWMFVETFGGIVKENIKMLALNKSVIRPAFVTGCILLIPLIAMQFTDQVDWGVFDFIVMGGLLFGMGFAFEMISKKAKLLGYRVACALAIGATFLLIWVNLAAGIIGSENNPANLMYLGVIAVGFIGVMIARFRPRSMALAMYSMAFAMALVGTIALIGDLAAPVNGRMQILWLHVLFVVLFSVSGLIFQKAHTQMLQSAATA